MHEGKELDKYEKEIKDLIHEYEQLADEQKRKYKYPDVETDEEIIMRFLLFLRETAVSHPNKKILVISHGGVMRTLLIHLGYATYDEDLYVSNASYFILESDGVDFEVKKTVGIEK
jgi:broad specificity phosphatase PhoE